MEKEWFGSVNVDGLKVAGASGSKECVISETMHYAYQYLEELEKRVTITIQEAK